MNELRNDFHSEPIDAKRERAYGLSLWQIFIGIGIIIGGAFLITGQQITLTIFDTGELKIPGPETLGPVLILLFCLNPLMRVLGIKVQLKQRDLIIIYIMAGVGIPTLLSFAEIHVGSWMGLPRFALERPDVFYDSYQLFSGLVMPKGEDVASGFWRGSAQVPWGAWIGPLVMWFIYYGIVVFIGMSLMTIVRRRWTEEEHLVFPLNIPVLQMTECREDGRLINSFWKNRLMWVGFLISGIFVLWEFLASMYAGVPWIDGGRKVYIARLVSKILTGQSKEVKGAFANFSWQIYPFIIGLSYFVSLDLLFSAWFFDIVFRRCVDVFMIKTNLNTSLFGPWRTLWVFHASEGFGGLFALGILYLWLMRGQLKDIITTALSKNNGKLDDSKEGLSYRIALLGSFIGLIILVLFDTFLLHKSPSSSILYFIIYYAVLIGSMRTRAEAGNPTIKHGAEQYDRRLMFYGLGEKAIGGVNGVVGYNLTGMMLTGGNGFPGIPAAALEGWALSDKVGLKRSSITKAIIIAFVTAWVSAALVMLPAVYRVGAYNARGGLINTWTWTNIWQTVVNARLGAFSQPKAGAFLPYLIGSAITTFLMFMKSRYLWWPLHPVGYIFGISQGFSYMVSGMMFIAWIIKFFILRYGGASLYKKMAPLFLGIFAGEVVLSVITNIIGIVAKLA